MPGCTTIGFMAESYRKDSTHEIKAEYTGLAGKSFAVVVSADRLIQADHPGLIDRLTKQITTRLCESKNVPRAGGYVPAEKVLRFTYDNPGWAAKPFSELAKNLGGVDRLVYIEITEYRLNEPGNAYEWDGLAAATVSVVESESATPDEFAFQKSVSVKFPDTKGFTPASLTQSAVTTVLASRVVDRASWLFYDHQEPYYPKY
ncbi:MAG: hypothetical protein JSR77_15815 [Planctomycetes bacterium]|nr:hypothetical protein [Planctomycetota bacterium]